MYRKLQLRAQFFSKTLTMYPTTNVSKSNKLAKLAKKFCLICGSHLASWQPITTSSRILTGSSRIFLYFHIQQAREKYSPVAQQILKPKCLSYWINKLISKIVLIIIVPILITQPNYDLKLSLKLKFLLHQIIKLIYITCALSILHDSLNIFKCKQLD